ncbi:MAG: hypothetical protein R3360_06340, partial [Alphaproteobacteria bacterium]|nr:hypothetical protein [Alphaproteobacteria bacterium]
IAMIRQTVSERLAYAAGCPGNQSPFKRHGNLLQIPYAGALAAVHVAWRFAPGCAVLDFQNIAQFNDPPHRLRPL